MMKSLLALKEFLSKPGTAKPLLFPERKAERLDHELLAFFHHAAGNRKSLSALGPAFCQYSATGNSCHTLTETVLVSSLSIGWLERAFHLFTDLRGQR